MKGFKSSPFEAYQLIYAKRHNIPAHWITQNEKLELAAFLEYQAGVGVLSLPDARRRFIAEYPNSNRLDVPRYIYDLSANTYRIDHNYANGSVLSLILPYEDSIREVSNLI